AEPCGGDEVIERGDPEAAADHDARRAEDVDERADRNPEVVADLAERRMLFAHEVARVRIRAEQTAGKRIDGPPGAIRLEMPAARARPLARDAVRHDHHVTELGPGAEQASGGH